MTKINSDYEKVIFAAKFSDLLCKLYVVSLITDLFTHPLLTSYHFSHFSYSIDFFLGKVKLDKK